MRHARRRVGRFSARALPRRHRASLDLPARRLITRHEMRTDPSAGSRSGNPAVFSATTADDGKGLTLHALDPAAFHEVANEVIALANRSRWRVTRLHRRGANI